jgi:spore maturation protein CgeB
MNIAFFGSSLLSAYWNGAATYYRGIIRALAERGHRVTFYEPDAYERQSHRDMAPPPWAESVVYPNEEAAMFAQIDKAARADLVIKASGVGVFDELLEAAVLTLKSETTQVAFWDVDAPATLERLQNNPADAFLPLIPKYDAVFTYGGGDPVVNEYVSLGAQKCVPIYNALDPLTHHPVPPQERFRADLAFLGNRLPDREKRVEEFFLRAAELAPDRDFQLGGSGWQDKHMPSNVRYAGHVPTGDHNVWNCSALAVLNISRESMARYGFSPATRVFEAAGAGACLITDAWEGIEHFFEPGEELLVASSGEEVAEILRWLTVDRARRIGANAYHKVLAEHTYAQRAEVFEQAIDAAILA